MQCLCTKVINKNTVNAKYYKYYHILEKFCKKKRVKTEFWVNSKNNTLKNKLNNLDSYFIEVQYY